MYISQIKLIYQKASFKKYITNFSVVLFALKFFYISSVPVDVWSETKHI